MRTRYNPRQELLKLGKQVEVTATETFIARGIKVVKQKGTVVDVDRTGEFGWIRVCLANGLIFSFRNHEVKLIEYKKLVTRSGLKIRIKRR